MPERPESFRLPDDARAPGIHDAVHAAAQALDVSRGLLYRLCDAAKHGFAQGDGGVRHMLSRAGDRVITTTYDGRGWTIAPIAPPAPRPAVPLSGARA